MGWKITIGGRSVLLDDLEIQKVDAVASRHDTSWFELTASSPARHPAAFYDLLRLVAEKLGVPPPEHDGTVRSMKRLLEHIDHVDDDLPSEWVDGNPPEGDPTTVSLSGSPESTDGLQQ